VLSTSRIVDTPEEMDALNARIAALEAEIEEYRAEYRTALPEDKRLLLETINNRSQTLNRLLDERKTAATAGIRC
jgi:chromosome segregation ATPase